MRYIQARRKGGRNGGLWDRIAIYEDGTELFGAFAPLSLEGLGNLAFKLTPLVGLNADRWDGGGGEDSRDWWQG